MAQDMQTFISADDIQQRVRALAAEIRTRSSRRRAPRLRAQGRVRVPGRSRARDARHRSRSTSWRVSSYGNSTRSSGQVQLLKDLGAGIEGRDVVIVEDIVDTGLTLTYLQDILRARAPRSLRTACLLSKPSRRQVEVKVDYVGFTIEDKFVVGYGLDFSEQYRNLPYIAVVDD